MVFSLTTNVNSVRKRKQQILSTTISYIVMKMKFLVLWTKTKFYYISCKRRMKHINQLPLKRGLKKNLRKP